jgi:hypothetical protein
MANLQPPPYGAVQGNVQWNAWFEQINRLLSGVTTSLNAIDDVVLASVTNNQLLQFDTTGNVWRNETDIVLPGTVDAEGIVTFAAAPLFQSTADVEGSLAANGGITGTTAAFTSTGDIEGAMTLGSTVDIEGVATFNAATHTIIGNATIEGSLLSVAETTDEFVLTFNAGTETWEGQIVTASDPVGTAVAMAIALG